MYKSSKNECKMDDKIIFSRHAILQLKERNLSKAEIISVLINPDKIIPQPPQKFRAVKSIKRGDKSYLLIVIYRQTNSIKKVITAFLTTKIKKYLK